jgi:CheY-like chemotaxis protein
VIAQRLVRRLCPECVLPATAPLTPDETRLAALAGTPPVNRAVGCDHCGETGYRGRIAVPEVLVISEPIERLIADGAPMPAILAQARAEGMRLLHEVALDAVRDGRTTLDEVERVIGLPEDLREGAKPAAAPAPSVGDRHAATPVGSRHATPSAAPAPPPVAAPAAAASADAPLVLLVDDDPVTRTAAREVVASQGMRTEEVGDGFAALQRLLSDAPLPDVVLLDLNMPGIDGQGVVRQLRHDARTRRLPIMILTGSGDREKELQLMEEGADDYLTKPIDPERLLARLRATLRRAAMR